MANWKLTDRDPNAPAWEDAELKTWHQRRMEVYAAMVDSMDQNIGRIVNKLRDKRLPRQYAHHVLCRQRRLRRGIRFRRNANPEDLEPAADHASR